VIEKERDRRKIMFLRGGKLKGREREREREREIGKNSRLKQLLYIGIGLASYTGTSV
jgi:hypothetical protein